MRERPILFSGQMVRAILEGRKTQTRRVVKEPRWAEPGGLDMYYDDRLCAIAKVSGCLADVGCPYGKPGDWLWVRETFGFDCMAGADECAHKDCIHYRADIADPQAIDSWNGHWKPSIFMPRWASRITLEITEVRVQRLQEISDEDAIAEGVERWVVGEAWREYGLSPEDEAVCGPPMRTARDSYRTLWESINGAGSWDANPWVWCVSFQRASTEVKA